MCEPPAELRIGPYGASERFYGIDFEQAGGCRGLLEMGPGVCVGVGITTEFPHIEGDLYRVIVTNADTNETLADIEEPAHFVVESVGNRCDANDDITCRHAEIRAAVY